MPKTTVVDPSHWLDEDGSFPQDPRLRKRMIRVAQCIEYGATLRAGEVRETLLSCRSRGCEDFVAVMKQGKEIQVVCPSCTDVEFLIHDWEGTPWAKGQQAPLRVAERAKARAPIPAAPSGPGASHGSATLERSLTLLGSALSAAEVRALVATRPHPGLVIQAVMASISGPPPNKAAVDRFLPVLMNVWNETPRDELGGKSPEQVYSGGRPAAVESPTAPIDLGRNRPCPCGSGKKYKRCCMSSETN